MSMLGDFIRVPKYGRYLEDHPSGCKWLMNMVRFRPLSRVSLVINGLNGFNSRLYTPPKFNSSTLKNGA